MSPLMKMTLGSTAEPALTRVGLRKELRSQTQPPRSSLRGQEHLPDPSLCPWQVLTRDSLCCTGQEGILQGARHWPWVHCIQTADHLMVSVSPWFPHLVSAMQWGSSEEGSWVNSWTAPIGLWFSQRTGQKPSISADFQLLDCLSSLFLQAPSDVTAILLSSTRF